MAIPGIGSSAISYGPYYKNEKGNQAMDDTSSGAETFGSTASPDPYGGPGGDSTFGRWQYQRRALGYDEFGPQAIEGQRLGELEAKKQYQQQRSQMEKEQILQQKQLALQEEYMSMKEEQAGGGKGGK